MARVTRVGIRSARGERYENARCRAYCITTCTDERKVLKSSAGNLLFTSRMVGITATDTTIQNRWKKCLAGNYVISWVYLTSGDTRHCARGGWKNCNRGHRLRVHGAQLCLCCRKTACTVYLVRFARWTDENKPSFPRVGRCCSR